MHRNSKATYYQAISNYGDVCLIIENYADKTKGE